MICHILTVSSQAWLVHCACEEGFTSYRNPLTQVANFAAKIENPTLNTAGDLLHGR